MYGQLRIRQAINNPSITSPHLQCLTAFRNLSLLSCESRRISQPSLSWKPEQRRNYGLESGKGVFRPSGRRVTTQSKKGQNIRSKALTYSHPLCGIKSQKHVKPSSNFDVPVELEVERPGVTRDRWIRDRLRTWEAEHGNDTIKSTMEDKPAREGIRNSGMGSTVCEEIIDTFPAASPGNDDNNAPFFERGELVDLGINRPFLLQGDMVELMVAGRRTPELAILVRQFQLYAQFYTMSGKWVNQSTKSVLFYVPKFVDPAELDDLLPYMPAADLPLTEQDKLQDFEHELPRNVGGPLVRKMLKFLKQTALVFRDHVDTLDNAHALVASESALDYFTLEQLAEKILPESAKESPGGRYPTWVLYAVHRALTLDPLGFRPQRGGTHRYGRKYEVSPKSERSIINRVTDYVRKYQEAQVGGDRVGRLEEAVVLPFVSFIEKAKGLIDLSRMLRKATTAGTLGPYKWKDSERDQALKIERENKLYKPFTDTDIEFIRFMESWVAMLVFNFGSPSNGIGSLILRATEKYPGLDLDQNMGWTFLQEIGVVAPWDNRVAFDLRLPNAGLLLSAQDETTASDIPLADRMESLRVDWESPVYCVDDPGAHEIDDGVSLEPIKDNPDEYWVHIHTADPASHIDPSSNIGRNAERMVSTVYLPERVVSMIPRDVTLELFSLANDRPSLTFGARMNNDGEILETKITPGHVRNVKYVTPPVVEEIVSGRKPVEAKTEVYAVGEPVPFKSSDSERVYLKVSELTNDDKENLKILHSLGHARRQKAVQRGALPAKAQALLARNATSISVQLNYLQPLFIPHHYNSDPRIELRTCESSAMRGEEREQTVTNLMLLGGEIAAIWCHERGIPIPYRVTPLNPEQPDPAKYSKEVLLPALERGDEKITDILDSYLAIMGTIQPSSTPGPHIGIGVSKFAKCTSPLRRYGDLLLHWQVEAALLEEARTGKSLVGSTREDYLPFSKKAVDDILPTIDGRERLIRSADRDARTRWIIRFIHRAWEFKEYPLPETFECEVQRWRSGLNGRTVVNVLIRFLGVEAEFDLPEWAKERELKSKDVFLCEFEDMNVYLKRLVVKPLKRVS